MWQINKLKSSITDFISITILFFTITGCASPNAGIKPDGSVSDDTLSDNDSTQNDVDNHDAGIDTGNDADTDIIDGGHDIIDGGDDIVNDIVDDVVGDVVDDSGITGLPYPTRTAYHIKAIQPDFWDPNDIAGNNAGGVAMNLVWSSWEATESSPPCSAGQQEYDGHCFNIIQNVDDAILDWTNRGLVVTAVVYGVPAWARQTINCSPVAAGFEIFCAPDNPDDFGRFAGMIAERYNGLNGHGRIADFVIHNEVNTNDWFDIGCGQGTPCNVSDWLDTYADNYNSAYDAIIAHQSEAKVLVSLTHHFDTDFDNPTAENPTLSVKTFLTGLNSRVGNRKWRVAYHPYAPNLLSPDFSPEDLPRVTYGNLGVLVGWLRTTFPSKPYTWTIQLTESGINSIEPNSNESLQETAVCNTFRNVLGTPGIENYIYHRMKDHPTEVASGLGLGLRRSDGTAKPAWSVWALANRNQLNPPQLDCGFENLPYTKITRSYLSSRGHWASSRLAPSGFAFEQAYFIYRDEMPGTQILYECVWGTSNKLDFDPACGGNQLLGPVGFILTTQEANTSPLYNCSTSGGSDFFISPDPACEGQTFEFLLGYVY